MIEKLKNKVHKFLGSIFIDIGDISNTILLAGCGRSGTTWVEEIINYDNSFRVMFEPFNSHKVRILKDWNYRQYIRPSNTDTKFLNPAYSILSGNIRNSWIDKYNRKVVSNKRIIKDIRANLFLKWIKQNFSDTSIVFLMRHPCAVANSKIKNGWDTHLNDFFIQDDLVNDFLEPFKNEIGSINDIFSKHIFMWCIENYVPLNQFQENEILIIFYENLCTNPGSEIDHLFSFIGQDFVPKVEKSIGKASAESRKDSAINSGENLVSSWRKNISEAQIRRAVDIMSLFGLHEIYNHGDFPLVSGKEALKLFPLLR